MQYPKEGDNLHEMSKPIGDNLHEMSKPYFLGKIIKISICHLLNMHIESGKG